MWNNRQALKKTSKLQTWPSYFLFVLLLSPCSLQPNSIQFLLVLVPIHLQNRVHWRLADNDEVNLRQSLFHLILLNVINLESKTQGHSAYDFRQGHYIEVKFGCFFWKLKSTSSNENGLLKVDGQKSENWMVLWTLNERSKHTHVIAISNENWWSSIIECY